MSHKSWNFTTYENGKPVDTAYNLDRHEAVAAIRAAIAGEPVVAATESDREAPAPVELARAA